MSYARTYHSFFLHPKDIFNHQVMASTLHFTLGPESSFPRADFLLHV